MVSVPELEAIVIEHSNALFGLGLTPSGFRIGLLAGGTRHVFRIVPSDPSLHRVVLKVRSPRRTEDHQAIATQTRHEFAVHSAVHEAMHGAGRSEHVVPKPLLSLPERGLLFMEQAPGRPVKQWMAREWLVARNAQENNLRVRRCGEWLFTFAMRAAQLRPPSTSDAEERILAAGRVNHHVYCLIGLTGATLIARMMEQIRHRLNRARIEARRAARIQEVFARALRELEGANDIQGNVHGKYSIADVLVAPDRVVAIDLEQTARGSLYLDPAYFLSQLVMFTRWQPVGSRRRLAALRAAFLAGRVPAGDLDERLLDTFIAYFLVNSLRPGGGIVGFTARARAGEWIDEWTRRAG